MQAHWSHGSSAALLGLLLLLAPPASAQSRNDFSYWDANGNGDLTCAEAEGRDGSEPVSGQLLTDASTLWGMGLSLTYHF